MEPVAGQVKDPDPLAASGDSNSAPMIVFKNQCDMGHSLGLLLTLKHHLKAVYNLSDARCTSYVPSTNRANEKPASRVEVIPKISLPVIPYDPSSGPIAAMSPARLSAFSLGVLLPMYDHFKQLMREDPLDFSSAITPFKSKKRKRSLGKGKGGRGM
jgi:hypothetical protein